MCSAIVGIFVSISAFSAEVPALPPSTNAVEMGLDLLVAQSLIENPEIRFYETEIAAAKGGRRQAGIYANPELSTQVGRQSISGPGPGSSAEGASWAVSVVQTFEYPGRIALRRAIANQDIKLAELGLDQFKATLAAQARTLGYDLIIKRQKAEAVSEVANRLQELLSVLVQRDPAGIAPLIELRIVESAVITFRKQAIDANRELQRAVFAINLLRGVPLDSTLRIKAEAIMFSELPAKLTLLGAARTRNFNILMRQAELEQQGLKVNLSENQRWPEISVGPFVSQDRAGRPDTVAGIGISLPLPLWNRNAGNMEVAKARQQQADASLFVTQRNVEQQVLDEWMAYTLKQQELNRWSNDTIDRIQEAAQLGDRHYRLGSLPIATYIELQREYVEAVGSILDLRGEAMKSLQQLQVLTRQNLGAGTPVPTTSSNQ